MRQAPVAFKPSQRKNHPNNKKNQGCSTFRTIIWAIALVLILAVVIIPTRYVSLSLIDTGSPSLKGSTDKVDGGSIAKGGAAFSGIAQKSSGGVQKDSIEKSSADLNSILKNSSADAKKSSALKRNIGTIKDMKGIVANKRRRIAYAITITKDGNFQDGAAILAYSIMEQSKKGTDDVSLVAFVHPNVTSSRPTLKRLGYHVIEVPTPINSTAIKFTFLREKINKNGCCGAAELIKLNSYRLLQYDWVVHMDADTLFSNPITELFDRNYSLIYTTDPNMASYKAEMSMPVQGGFLVLKPSINDYEKIINILLTKEFRKGKGWDSSKIGWFWGGMTVQGVLPYYYNTLSQTKAYRSQKIDRCIYNTMADTPDCLKQSLDEIKSVHFTVCQKPWSCYKAFVNPLCAKFHKRWFELRLKSEKYYGIPQIDKPCIKEGRKNKYIPMKILDDSFHIKDKYFVLDDSPNRLEPIGNNGYVLDGNNTVFH
jgi:lipopolysaccharide biosynthesis glycosyltransferase